MKKIALITGITGQDGSYLAEFLLKEGYEVHGIVRRSSSFNTQRIDHIIHEIIRHYGDVTDALSIDNIMFQVKPDEIYHLGAQSHVRVSFDVPGYTAQTDAVGTLNMLEAMRKHAPKAKFYNAATSELFGKVLETPQKETTPFNPRSPYGVAKLYAYHIVKNYRESFNLFAVNGILFNHECVTYDTPFIIKDKNDFISIKSINEISKMYTDLDLTLNEKQTYNLNENLYVWDKNGWTKIRCISCHKDDNKIPYLINSRNSIFNVSNNHKLIKENGENIKCEDIKINDKLSFINSYPKNSNQLSNITLDEARLMGFAVGDGTIFGNEVELTQKDKTKLVKYQYIWENMGGYVKYRLKTSGFTKINNINGMFLLGLDFFNNFKFYDDEKFKIVPEEILNSTKEIMTAFLEGYNDADGLKKSKGISHYKSFKTNSYTLASQLIYIINQTTHQQFSLYADINKNKHNKFYFTINLNSNSSRSIENLLKNYEIVKIELLSNKSFRQIEKETGIRRAFISKVSKGYIPKNNHLVKCNNEVIKKIKLDNYNNLYFDIETESHTFNCGIGKTHINNSERRGSTFVTKKITEGLMKYINYGESFNLGNLDAKRDWGYAPDFVKGMWLMLQQDTPDDFVLATGETHTIKEFINECILNINESVSFEWKKDDEGKDILWDVNEDVLVIGIDPIFYRAAEVDLLLGDASKAKEILGWEAKTKFKKLVKIMMKNELKNAKEF